LGLISTFHFLLHRFDYISLTCFLIEFLSSRQMLALFPFQSVTCFLAFVYHIWQTPPWGPQI
jgi:hypothetical protein